MILSLEKIKYFLFYFFLALLPFNFRHIFNFEQASSIEGFRENFSYSLYAFDIVFVVLFLIIISTYISTLIGKSLQKNSEKNKGNSLITNYYLQITLFAFIFILLISSFFSKNQVSSFYNSFRIIETVIFFLIAKDIFSNKGAFRNSAVILFFSGLFQSTVAVFQFIFQKSIGLKMLGESIIAPDIPGVAKIEIYGEKMIRAYGTFPHPNLLGAFLLLSLACGIYLISKNIIMSFPRHACFDREASRADRRESRNSKTLFTGCWLLIPIITAILLTFSRSVWLVVFLFFLILLFLYFMQNKNVLTLIFSRLTFGKIVTAIAIMIFALLLISPRLCLTNCPNDDSYALRKIYSQAAKEIIQTHPVIGVGPGSFTLFLVPCNCPCGLQPWEIQPVHNLYLLIASEIGILGLICFILIIVFNWKFKIIKLIIKLKNYKIKNSDKSWLSDSYPNIFLVTFSAFLFLAFFDHYFWTLPQGQFLFWLTLAMAASKNKLN